MQSNISKNKKKILFIAAHPDDEILGAGGTIAHFIKQKHQVYVIYMSEGVSARYSNLKNKKFKKETIEREIMAKKASSVLNFKIIKFFRLKNMRMKYEVLMNISKKIQKYIEKIEPDEIFTHHSSDLNPDHKTTFDAVFTACRPSNSFFVKKICLFEIPSSTDWSSNTINRFHPNLFIDIENYIGLKNKALKCYDKELRLPPHPRSLKNLEALSVFRGGAVNLKYAEAFQIIRSVK